jgi:type III pantothenate kinase
MIMCIDIGNTNVSFLINSPNKVRFNLSTDKTKTEDEYFFNIMSVLNYYNINKNNITKIVACSVVPQLNFTFARLCEKYFAKTLKIIESGDINIKINLPNPNEVGTDRLIDAYASTILANQIQTCKASLIIDFGTATTFNLSTKNEDESWQYEGGVIFPGINLSLESLKNATAKLPRVSFIKCESVVAKNTTDAINSGMFFGYKSLVSGLIDEFKAIHPSLFVIATGGLSGIICEQIKLVNLIQKDLTLQTILQIAMQGE